MTMRRISVLLVAVVMAMMLSMGPAFARGGHNYTICHNGNTWYNLSYKQAKWHVRHHSNDYWGKCHKRGANVGQITYNAVTGVWR